MKKILLFVALIYLMQSVFAQNGDNTIVNTLPDYIPASPDAASIIKAQQIGINYSSGSPNINIPLGNLNIRDFNLPITLSYNSTGVKVDDYATMIGMGWNLTYGGVISRTVEDKPDEGREPGRNAFTADFSNQNEALWEFLNYAYDKHLDIFSINLPNYSGKFILDSSFQPAFLTNSNYRLQVIDGAFTNGLILTTDDGTQYFFQDAEISQSRNPSGTNCEKTNDGVAVITSWYLTKIILPSTRKWIDFTYTTSNIISEYAITQTVSQVTSTEQYTCAWAPYTGNACSIGTERFSTCIPTQTITTKYITKIQTSDGDRVDFIYDGITRADIQGGKRLSWLTITNRNGWVIRRVDFNSSYRTAITSGPSYRMKRLFLDNLVIRAVPTETNPTRKLLYQFSYIDYDNLPARLSYGQDFYGFYNGKNSNASLIPVLSPSDINYTTFNNGTHSVFATFGDRSIDSIYAIKGLLNRIIYPAGGYDTIQYRPNKHLYSGVEKLAGGNAVYKISTYSANGMIANERMFIYRNYGDNSLSSLLLNDNPIFSQVVTTRKDGFICTPPVPPGGAPFDYFEGPQCNFAVVTSNSIIPLTAMGGEHIFHQSVLVYEIGQSGSNGMMEHRYSLFNSGNLGVYHRLGNFILEAPYQVVPDIVLGETQTNVYKGSTGGSYQLLKGKLNYLRMSGFRYYPSYVTKHNFVYISHTNPPVSYEFDPFDAEEIYINKYTVLLDSTVETDYSDPSNPIVTRKSFQYGNPIYPYPTKITTIASDLSQNITSLKYPQDYASYNFMTSRNIVAPIVEERKLKKTSVLTTTTNTYVDWFGNTKNIVLQSIELKHDTTTQMGKILFTSYDTLSNVQELSKINDEKVSYIWDYNSDHPVAKVINASQSTIAYTSFEADGWGGWTMNPGSVIYGSDFVTGKKSFGGVVYKNGLPPGTYIVTLWGYGPGTQTVNGMSGTTLLTVGHWALRKWEITNPGNISVAADNCDEVRLYPKGAEMTTYTYDPLVGITTLCDLNNSITYYEYDEIGRLILIRDQDKNVLKKFAYNYSGQPEALNIYYNTLRSQIFTKNNCSPGNIGSQVTYTVPAGKYSSTFSQSEADAQATNEINLNGQNYANGLGTCIPAITIQGYNSKTQNYNLRFTNNSTGTQYNFTLTANTFSPQTLGAIPSGTYTVLFYPQGAPISCTFYINGFTYFGTGATFNNISITSLSTAKMY